jgi:hypothetical protein
MLYFCMGVRNLHPPPLSQGEAHAFSSCDEVACGFSGILIVKSWHHTSSHNSENLDNFNISSTPDNVLYELPYGHP